MPPHEGEIQPTKVKPNPRNNATMFQIFQNVQYNVVQHKKYVKEMKKLYKKLDEETFRESFKNALHYLFTFGDTSANVDRVVTFVATFCTSLDDEEEFLLFICDVIFNCQCVSGQSVRYRASQLLAALLAALGDDASLDDDLCDKLLASQMQRLQDTRGAVRCRAALALQRLQNPMDSDDEVTRAYRFHMSCDPSSSVRRAVVMSIAKCSRNVPFVLERVRDTDEAVRRAAFLYIAAINVTQLRIRQRLCTLKVGLTERSPRVRRVVEEILLPGWLSTFKGNIIDLLRAIRLDNVNDAKDSHEVAGKLLDSLFKRLPVSELLEWLPTDKTLRLIPGDKLNKETALYWRHLAEHLHKLGDDETAESVLPDLVVLVEYIKAIVDTPSPCPVEQPVELSTRLYVLRELACLLQVYDAGDHVGRTQLQECVTNVLTGDHGPLTPDVIRAFVNALSMVIPDVNRRVEVIAHVISELREPEADVPLEVPLPIESNDTKLLKARLRVSLNVAMEAQEEAVRDQDYALADECKAKVKDIQRKLEELNMAAPAPPPPPPPTSREKLCDAATLNKCLMILNCALDTPSLTTVTPMLKMIYNELEVEIFQNPDLIENALETVALYGMLDKELAKENKAFFFANLIDTSNEQLVCTVLKCIVDLLCVHGAKVFEDDDVTSHSSHTKLRASKSQLFDDEVSLSESALSLSQNHSTVIELLLKIMDSTCSSYRLIIVEGLCRLLFLGHLESPTILSRLMLLWFNPATIDEDLLRQIIGVFFQSFASSVEGAQDQIQRATIPTLRALANAPSSSPIAEIDQEAVVRFIVSLTRVNHEVTDSQGNMAMLLCSYLSRNPQGDAAPLACRVLSLLSTPRDQALAHDLANVLRSCLEKVADKQSARNLTRYLGALEASERASLTKMSTQAEITGQTDDTVSRIGRMTSSLPHPIGRSTHVVINDTVEEEVEIDETSPPDVISRISEEPSNIVSEQPRTSTNSETEQPASPAIRDEHRKSASTDNGDRHSAQSDSTPITSPRDRDCDSDSSDVSPVKKAKVAKGKKKKSLSVKRKGTKSGDQKSKAQDKPKGKDNKQSKEDDQPGRVKRSRSQRSLDDIERANKAKSKAQSTPPNIPADLDTSNVTVRRSTRPLPSSSSTDSTGDERKGGKTKDSVIADLDVSNVTVRRSTKPQPSSANTDAKSSPKQGQKTKAAKGNKQKTDKTKKPPPPPQRHSPRLSGASSASLFDDSADETELHTIVYDQDVVQSLLDDSTELAESKNLSKTQGNNVTIPETPSEDSEIESEPEIIQKKSKGKANNKKK